MGIRRYNRTVSKPTVVCSFPYEYFSVFGCNACSAEGNRNRCGSATPLPLIVSVVAS